ENLLGFLFMAPFSQELEPPQNPVRFMTSATVGESRYDLMSFSDSKNSCTAFSSSRATFSKGFSAISDMQLLFKLAHPQIARKKG
ncbi:hypothetical protein, partial [Burkholderia sp. SIMBA_062]|uniref:hypothetical protein n=1 Tax=Burkholderia sp. SIMBA_062 TaxID=3085803 RepID=UPI00397820CC